MFSGWNGLRGMGLLFKAGQLSSRTVPLSSVMAMARRNCGYYESPHSVQSHAPGIYRPVTDTPTEILPPPTAVDPEEQARSDGEFRDFLMLDSLKNPLKHADDMR